MVGTTSRPGIAVRYERPDGQVVEERFTDTFTIGRDMRCNVRLAAPVVSSMHARVSRLGEGWQIQDLYSRNGLYVDGQTVQQVEVEGQVQVQFGHGGPFVVLRVDTSAPLQQEVPGVLESTLQAMPLYTPGRRPPGPSVSSMPAPRTPADVQGERYEAARFSLPLPEGWRDTTVFILAGPLTDGIQHNITVSLDPETPFEAVKDFAEVQVQALEESLPGIQVLKQEAMQLARGTPAYRVIFKWSPAEDQTLFQQQVYVVDHGTAYRLTASFSRKTRKTVGPEVTRTMLAFEPKP